MANFGNCDNPNVMSLAYDDDNDLMTIFLKSNKLITVPDDAPLIDPYDTKTGKGFMLPNAIIRSALSGNAKLAYCVLRSHICYRLGFVFITQSTLAKGMSKEARVVRRATEELENCGVIRIVKGRWKNHTKLYFYFMPEKNWKLPQVKNVSAISKHREVNFEIDSDE